MPYFTCTWSTHTHTHTHIYAAKALSKVSSTHNSNEEETKIQEKVEWFMQRVIPHLPATKEHLERIHQQQAEYPICSKRTTYVFDNSKNSVPLFLKPYWTVQGELSYQEGIYLIAAIKLYQLHCRNRSCKRSIMTIKALLGASIEYPPANGGWNL